MLENTNIKQFYPGPILNKTLDITDFLFKDPEQIHITYTYKNEDGSLDNRELTYGTEYEVTKILPSDVTQADAALTASTGRVTLKADVNVVLGEKLTLYRESEIIQEAQYPRTGPFPAASHEGALDYLTMQNQEQQDQIDRSLKVPISTANFDGALPIPVPARALKINDSGTGFELSEYDPDTALVTTKEYMEGAQTAASNALASQNAAASSASAAAASANSAATSANSAAISAATVSTKTEEVIAAGETALENIQQETTEAITNITVEGETQINNVKSTGFYMQDGTLYYTDSEGNSKKFTQGGGLPLASIYLAPFGIDESKNLGRYLNGQVIIQSQFTKFTKEVKSWQTTRPDLFTTETNWQAEKTASKLGQCGKFVVDDTAGTIRLPLVININGLTDLANCGVIKNERLPNITGKIRIPLYNNRVNEGAFYIASTGGNDYGSNNGGYTAGFSASRSSSTYQDNAPVQQEAIQYPYVIVVNTGVEDAERPINNYQVNNVYSYGVSQYYKGVMNNNSWLRSAGQWNPGTTYNGVYDWAVSKLNEKVYDPSKFTVVGSPTITSDGIASGFSSGNYINTGFIIDLTKINQEFEICFSTTSDNPINVNKWLISAKDRTFGLNYNTNNKIDFSYNLTGGTSYTKTITYPTVLKANTTYFAKISTKFNSVRLYVQEENNEYSTYVEGELPTGMATNQFLCLGYHYPSNIAGFNGSIDLKSFSITVDGEEVFSGSKIVQADGFKKSTDSDITDYDWVVNTEEQTFRLPIKNGQEGVFASGVKGNGKPLLFDDGSGNLRNLFQPGNDYIFTSDNIDGTLPHVTSAYNGSAATSYVLGANVGIVSDSSKSGIVVDLTVPDGYNLYYYIGDVLENADLINIARMQEELVDRTTAAQAAHAAMPSDKYINLTLGASGQSYTAPADGYFYLHRAITSTGYQAIINLSSGDLTSEVRSHVNGGAVRNFLPCKKNDSILIAFDGAYSSSVLRFIYAVGSEPTT